MSNRFQGEPCPRCDWKFPGFHICLDLTKAELRKVHDGNERDSNGQIIPREGRSAEHRQAISDGVRRRNAQSPAKIARDKEIERLYVSENLSIKEISIELGIADRTVGSALHRAQDAGRLTIRSGRKTSGV